MADFVTTRSCFSTYVKYQYLETYRSLPISFFLSSHDPLIHISYSKTSYRFSAQTIKQCHVSGHTHEYVKIIVGHSIRQEPMDYSSEKGCTEALKTRNPLTLLRYFSLYD